MPLSNNQVTCAVYFSNMLGILHSLSHDKLPVKTTVITYLCVFFNRNEISLLLSKKTENVMNKQETGESEFTQIYHIYIRKSRSLLKYE